MEFVDFNEDNIIGRDDLEKMMDRLTGQDNTLSDETKKVIIDKVSGRVITNSVLMICCGLESFRYICMCTYHQVSCWFVGT